MPLMIESFSRFSLPYFPLFHFCFFDTDRWWDISSENTGRTSWPSEYWMMILVVLFSSFHYDMPMSLSFQRLLYIYIHFPKLVILLLLLFFFIFILRCCSDYREMPPRTRRRYAILPFRFSMVPSFFFLCCWRWFYICHMPHASPSLPLFLIYAAAPPLLMPRWYAAFHYYFCAPYYILLLLPFPFHSRWWDIDDWLTTLSRLFPSFRFQTYAER